MTPEEIAYLRQAAARDGYSPNDALKVFAHESSGNPNIWGGKGGKYYGLFQAGPSERAQFGVDTQHPSAQNQIDAFGRFLHARGFKPGMGLMDMYSTVLAGSPGHYGRSDGAGTVAEHVARMGGAPNVSGGSRSPYSFALNAIPQDADLPALPESSDDKAAQAEEEAQASRKSLLSSLQTLTAKQQQPAIDPQVEAQSRAFQEFANQQHQQALGLLSSGQRGLLGA